jgi:hypothetical protein
MNLGKNDRVFAFENGISKKGAFVWHLFSAPSVANELGSFSLPNASVHIWFGVVKHALQKNHLLFSTFPMLVPNLSW